MLIKVVKCFALTILAFIGVFVLTLGINTLINMFGETIVMLILFGITIFGTIFSLIWNTLFN